MDFALIGFIWSIYKELSSLLRAGQVFVNFFPPATSLIPVLISRIWKSLTQCLCLSPSSNSSAKKSAVPKAQGLLNARDARVKNTYRSRTHAQLSEASISGRWVASMRALLLMDRLDKQLDSIFPPLSLHSPHLGELSLHYNFTVVEIFRFKCLYRAEHLKY